MRTKVAVVGGGSTGSSILYHLAKRGVTDCVLVEQGSEHRGGTDRQVDGSRQDPLQRPGRREDGTAQLQVLQEISGRSCRGTGPATSRPACIIGVDKSAESSVRQSLDMFRQMGIASGFVDREQARKLEPCLDTSSFSSVVYEPNMGYAEPSTTASSFASAAQVMGARVLTGTTVLGLSEDSRRLLPGDCRW